MFTKTMFSFSQILNHSRFWVHAAGKIRRFFLVHFQKKYVKSQLEKRTGQCQRCGACCNLLFTCPMLTTTGKCSVYGLCRPKACKVFPIDQRDIEEIKLFGKKCGYSFEPLIYKTLSEQNNR